MIFLLGILKLLMKIFFAVVLVIVLLIIIICLSSISARISFWDGKLEWSVRWFGLKLLPRKKKTDKPETSAEEKKQEASGKEEPEKEEPETEKKPEKLFMDVIWEKMQKFAKRLDTAGSAVSALPPALRCFRKALTWDAIETDILIADEDASDCARKYGLMQILFQNLFGLSGCLIHVRRKHISIRCDFIEDTPKYNFRCRVKLHIGKTIIAGIVFLWYYFKDKAQAKKTIVSQKL